MKCCRTCQRVYADEGMNFCLDDGTVLFSDRSMPGEFPTVRFASGRPIGSTLKEALPDKTLMMDLTGPGSLTTHAGRRQATKPRAISSIAVLPFVNASPDPDMEYISDGITESIINLLSQLPGLHVVARNTMFRYKGEVDPRIVSEQLGVRAVVTGRVRQAGDLLLVGTELIDVVSDSQLWGEHFNRRLADIFEVQEEIAREISERLPLKLSSRHKKLLTKRYTGDSEAYELYLKGRYHWNKLTAEGFRRSIEFFEQAAQRDTGFALAQAGLADVYGVLGYLNYAPPKEAFPASKRYAMNALELDGTLAEAHLSLAGVRFFYEWDWLGAENEFKRALSLNPGYATAHHIYGHYLASLGRFEQAIAQMERAHELDPLSLSIGCSIGFTSYRARIYDEAIKRYQSVLDLDATLPLAHEGLSLAYLQKGTHDEAVAEHLDSQRHWPGSDEIIRALRAAYAESGMDGYWRKWLELYNRQMMPNHVTSYFPAVACAILGEKDLAFEWLEKAFEERIGFLVYIKVEPVFDSLRADARFANLLSRVGL